MRTPIQTFEPNDLGRDFVIGDLHGSLSCFNKLLEGIQFDLRRDRMFSVGDLVDRGPDSLSCLELIKEPWFHPVLANHEQMMLEAFEGGYLGQFWIQNGGRWGLQAYNDMVQLRNNSGNLLLEHTPEPDSARLFEVLHLAADLPFLITIKMKDGKKFHVIHAELPPNEYITDETLASPEDVLRLATSQTRDGDFFLWGRHMFGQLSQVNMSNHAKIKRSVAYRYRESFGVFNDELSHIISGHTIMQHPITIIGQTNIDTGAYGSYHDDAPKHEALTCIELQSWTFYQATENIFREVTPIEVNRADILTLRPEFAVNPGIPT